MLNSILSTIFTMVDFLRNGIDGAAFTYLSVTHAYQFVKKKTLLAVKFDIKIYFEAM